MQTKNLIQKLQLPLIIIGVILLNQLAGVWHARADLTADKRFTLTTATKKLLENLPAPATVDVFLNGNYPSGFKRLAASTQEMLQQFKELAGSNIQYNFIAPTDVMPGTQTSYGDSLSALGLYPINLTSQVAEGQQQQLLFPFALVHVADRTVPVTLYQGKTPVINFQELSSAEATLEYNLANGISKASQTQQPVIGYAIGNGEPTGIETYDLVQNVLGQDYRVFTFNPNTQPFVPREFNVLLLVKPATGFSELAKLRIDQYLMQGGKVMLFEDRLNAELDSLQKGEVVAFDRDLKLNDLLFKYGVRVNADLLMDLQCDFLPFDVNGNGQFQLLPWNYFPVLEADGNHPITKNLGFVSGRFVNTIDTVEAAGLKKTVLLHSSANARTIATPAIISGKENSTAPQNEKFNRANIPVAVLLEGKFNSLYANRLTTDLRDSLAAYDLGFVKESTGAGSKLIVIADGDIVLNETIKGGEPIPMGMNKYTYGTQRQFPFANKDFLQNCLDYLINENGLSDAKGKDYVVRLLDNKRVGEEKTYWQLLNIAVPVILVTMFAFGYNFWRKRHYSRKINDG